MFADFNRVFKPTKEQLINKYETLLKIHNEQIGKCSTCVHYVCCNTSSIVVDYGSCKKGMKNFFDNLWNGKEGKCSEYEEYIECQMMLKERLKKLKLDN